MARKYVMQEDEDLFEDRKYFNKHIERINHPQFREVEDIDLENLREFLRVVLHAFQEKKVDLNDILDILDYLHTYIHRRYMDEWPETHWPIPSDNDPMSIGLNALDFIDEGVWQGNLLPNVMNPLLSYLQTFSGQERKATESIAKFIETLKIEREKKAIRRSNGSHIFTFDQLEEK